MNLKWIYGLLWMLFGVGVTLSFGSDVITVRQVGHVLAIIALLTRLFLYLRSMQPPHDHFAAYEQPLPVLDLSTPASPLPPAGSDAQAQTPVERLLSEEK
jgi:hypothetical protein